MRHSGIAIAAGMAALIQGATPTEATLPKSFSLQPEFSRFGLAPREQQGPTCWAHTVTGCLELELSRRAGKSVRLSVPFLIWAASRTDTDTLDGRGSNFGRAARALSRFGICTVSQTPTLQEGDAARARIAGKTIREGLQIGRGIEIDWLRFWRQPIGLTDSELRAIKERICAGHPVAIGMYWPRQLTVDDPTISLIGTCKSLDETEDGHCVVLAGYEDDDRLPGGGAFLIRNSFGDTWMSGGYARLSYEYVRRFGNDLLSFDVCDRAPGGFQPNGQAPSNATDTQVINLRAEDCVADSHSTLRDSDMKPVKAGLWQSDDQVVLAAKGAGDGFTVKVNAPRTGRYTIEAAVTRGPDSGRYRILVDGNPIGSTLDLAWPGLEPTGAIPLGAVTLQKGPHTIRFECIGKALASGGYEFGVDWLALRPEPSNAKSAK